MCQNTRIHHFLYLSKSNREAVTHLISRRWSCEIRTVIAMTLNIRNGFKTSQESIITHQGKYPCCIIYIRNPMHGINNFANSWLVREKLAHADFWFWNTLRKLLFIRSPSSDTFRRSSVAQNIMICPYKLPSKYQKKWKSLRSSLRKSLVKFFLEEYGMAITVHHYKTIS